MKFTEVLVAIASILFIINQLKNLCKNEDTEKESSKEDLDDVDASTTSEKSEYEEEEEDEEEDIEESEEEQDEETEHSTHEEEAEEAEEESFEKAAPVENKPPSRIPTITPKTVEKPIEKKEDEKPKYKIERCPDEKNLVYIETPTGVHIIMHPRVEEIMKKENEEERVKALLDLEKKITKPQPRFFNLDGYLL